MSEFFEYDDVDDISSYTTSKAVLKGEFSLSNFSVPYFQSNLTLLEVNNYLKLVEDMPSEQRHKWSLEELFQRDINWDRVEDDIVKNYLKIKEKRTFFNALTVALLPLSTSGTIDSRYSESQKTPPSEKPFNLPGFKVETVGGIQLASNSDSNSNIQYLRWDQSNTFAVAIDGQHRLAALKRYFDSSSLTNKQRETRVPVIFLVLDPKVGFDMPDIISQTDDNPLLSVVREVFVDLNKHAKLVSNARQILLDDQDLESKCTRNLLATKTREETTTTLPLGLVNWKDDSVKFDTGPYITSVSVLHLVIKDFLNIKYPDDPLDEGSVVKFINSVEQTLFISQTLNDDTGKFHSIYANKKDLKEYCILKLTDDEEPIKILPYEYSLAAIDSFNKNYKPLIVGIFQQFITYKVFWDEVRTRGGIDGEMAYYNSLSASAQSKEKDTDLSLDYHNKIAPLDKELTEMKKGKWAFTVVWQKALLKATIFAYYQVTPLFGEDLDHDSFLKKWIDFLNFADEQSLFDINSTLDDHALNEGKLWEGISINPGTHTIKYSNSAVKKINELILLYWFFYNSGVKDVDAFIQLTKDIDSNSRFPGSHKMLGSIFNSFKTIAKSKSDNEEINNNYCATRLKLVLGKLWATNDESSVQI